ncbi:hypothetical protein A2671_02530 [Candidatus Kaiserbacteria bacterium RIFCSPHIGHO2_01_FULL_49_13]|uniref:YbjN domain-containing protein n=1 Tax=Candidatus Kaiserbacteria bacterium RIFCSPHIGHO2_01_FULL_49_13 TaxID=1798477 RepID=A0A1F6CDZ1_9BACT|nr:MAG: hypothetical protein A2671_02530 [Candidatus Kaiserbacteria bacterium RIFCSPHIGHO2_01_FULL_49_13]
MDRFETLFGDLIACGEWGVDPDVPEVLLSEFEGAATTYTMHLFPGDSKEFLLFSCVAGDSIFIKENERIKILELVNFINAQNAVLGSVGFIENKPGYLEFGIGYAWYLGDLAIPTEDVQRLAGVLVDNFELLLHALRYVIADNWTPYAAVEFVFSRPAQMT